MQRLAIMAVLLAVCGCSPSYYRQGIRHSEDGDHARAAEMFYEEIRANPQSFEAWRELGINFYRAGDLDRAGTALDQANTIQMDARTTLYLGLFHEKRQDYDKALESYRTAIGLEPRGKTRQMIRAHLNAVVRAKVTKEVESALAEERTLGATTIPDNTIAVANFDNSGLPAEIRPLSRGLVEFTALDLGKVRSLQVVERQKIDVLMKELALSESNLVDSETRLRIGKLAGSRNLVTGSLLLVNDEKIEVHGVVGNTVEGSSIFTDPATGDLKEFFRVQKTLVFEIIDSMGITLTPEERTAIQQVPTESYLALIAYCRGLEQMDQGNYEQARQAFQEASSADRGFTAAETQAEIADGGADLGDETGQGAAEAFEAAVASASPGSSGEQDYLAVIIATSNFVPSDESGKPAANETAKVPDSGIVGPVNVTVVGDFDGSK